MAVHPDRLHGAAFCSGVGGLELGLEIVFPDQYAAVLHVERENYAAACLVARMAEGTLAAAPIWDDVGTLDGRRWRGRVDIVSAGFPCQPWSSAGRGDGFDDERWIWPDIRDRIREMEPDLVWLENVPPIVLRGGLAAVLGDLADLGFDAVWDVFSAADVGGSHRRERIFILAYRRGVRLPQLRAPYDDDRRHASGDVAHRRDPAVADAEGVDGRAEQPARGAWSGRRGSAGAGLALADATGARCGRREDTGTDRGDAAADGCGRGESQRDGRALADADGTRLQGRECGGAPRGGHGTEASRSAPELCGASVGDTARGGQRAVREPSGGERLADGPDAAVAESDGAGLSDGDGQRVSAAGPRNAEPQRRDLAVEDAARDREYGSLREDGRRRRGISQAGDGVADAGDGQLPQSERRSQGRTGTRSASAGDVADAECDGSERRRGTGDVAGAAGRLESEGLQRERRGCAVGDLGDRGVPLAVADAASAGGRQFSGGAAAPGGEARCQVHDRRAAPQTDGPDAGGGAGARDVADAGGDAVRLEPERDQRDWRDARTAEREYAEPRADVPLFPPPPGDIEQWRRVLAVRPDLAPALTDERSVGDMGDATGEQQRDERERHSALCGGRADEQARPASTSDRLDVDAGQAEVKSPFCRVADGPSPRVDRLRACGNSVVPLAAAYAFCTLAAVAGLWDTDH